MKDNAKLKQIINRFYGITGQGNTRYCDTDSLLVHDCDFCRNANTCNELSHDNDLSYLSCGKVYLNGLRLLFRSGDKKPTTLLVEWFGLHGWETIAILRPSYCPFCGRHLFENHEVKEKK